MTYDDPKRTFAPEAGRPKTAGLDLFEYRFAAAGLDNTPLPGRVW